MKKALRVSHKVGLIAIFLLLWQIATVAAILMLKRECPELQENLTKKSKDSAADIPNRVDSTVLSKPLENRKSIRKNKLQEISADTCGPQAHPALQQVTSLEDTAS